MVSHRVLSPDGILCIVVQFKMCYVLLSLSYVCMWPRKSREGFQYRDWKHAREVLKCHNDCYVHKTAMLSWDQYLLGRKTGTSVDSLLDSVREKRKQENRHYLRTITVYKKLQFVAIVSLMNHREGEIFLSC